jgi:hypothetical protein
MAVLDDYWSAFSALSPEAYIQQETKPIFPPRGFAGKSDAELWEMIAGEVDDGIPIPALGDLDGLVLVWADGEIALRNPDRCEEWILTPQAAQSLQRAIGNALVLHARLTENTDVH